jgi:oligo-1,6-glucosidase
VENNWWKERVVYQIYPRSFQDSNDDGIGDLNGIIKRLDYLQELGIGIIWLSPVYKSPNDDNGYDISDYQDIMNEFGTLADFEILLREAHSRDIKIVMDLVVNHSSDEHRWFAESKKSKDNPYRDYYIWQEGKAGRPPNNWGSFFSGSAWQYDATTAMYYLHLFTKKQPDLNWENPALRKEVYDMMKWWLDKGIDGFRMDVINLISKDQAFPDAPQDEDALYGTVNPFGINLPRIHEYLQEMNREVLSKYDIMAVGETSDVTTEEAQKFTSESRKELNMVFQFEHVNLGSGKDGKWDNLPTDFLELKKVMSRWQTALENEGWNSLYWGNHDQPRCVSRFGNDGPYWQESAKMLVTCLHMMKGTPYIYQGDEIGMTNVAFASLSDYRDVEILNAYQELVHQKGKDPKAMMQAIYDRGRDNARTPVQWDDSPNAGFTGGTPWIKVNPNYKRINAALQLQDENSIFNYYKKIIRLRKEHPIIVYGKYDWILADDVEIYAYTRTLDQEQLLIICSFTANPAVFELPSHITYNSQLLLISNYAVTDPLEKIQLKPYEARVYLLT